MSVLASSEIDIALSAFHAFVQRSHLAEHIHVLFVFLYHLCVNLIQFRAVCRTGDSEDIVHILFLLSRNSRVLVRGVGCFLREVVRRQLVVSNEALAVLVGVGLVDSIRYIHQLHQYHDLAFLLHALYRGFEPRVAVLARGVFGEVLAVVQTLQAHHISRRILGVVAKVLNTLIAHLQQQMAQTVFLSLVSSVLVLPLDDFATLRIDSLVGIRASGIYRPPRLVGISELFVLHTLVEERHIDDALLSDGGFCLGLGYLHGGLLRLFGFYFLRFLCAAYCRNNGAQRQSNKRF